MPGADRDELFGVLAGSVGVMKAEDPIVQEMLRAARAAMKNAYCKYSRFPRRRGGVDSAGGDLRGCNVENASYGLTSCAERNAIFQAVAKGRQMFRAIVIVTPKYKLTPPCGACRQVINEFNPKTEVFIFGRRRIGKRFKLSELLPGAFGPGDLKTKRARGAHGRR